MGASGFRAAGEEIERGGIIVVADGHEGELQQHKPQQKSDNGPADVRPIYFENEWGLTQPKVFTEGNYKVHSPAWALGFQKLTKEAGAVCHLKFPDHPKDGYRGIRNFIVQELQRPAR